MTSPATPTIDRTPNPDREPSPVPQEPPGRHWDPRALAAALLLGIAALVLVVVFLNDSSGGGADTPVPDPGSSQPLELSLGTGDALASCIPFDTAILADMSPAFLATATAVDGERVTLAVDHWYAGGDAATVELVAQGGMEALIGGFPLEVGTQYLITAANGTVNFCGYSGEATPELRTAFDAAFGASG